MSDDIAVITFPERSTTYEAFSKISADSDRLGLVSAALIEVDEHGRFTIPEGEDNRFGFGVGTGSLIGVLVGALGGPIGMLLGLGVGALAGAAVDTDRAESDELAVTAFVGKLAPGQRDPRPDLGARQHGAAGRGRRRAGRHDRAASPQ